MLTAYGIVGILQELSAGGDTGLLWLVALTLTLLAGGVLVLGVIPSGLVALIKNALL